MQQSILMVSKPIAPPWNDSSKNLVKDLVCSGSRYSYRIFTPTGFSLDASGVVSEPIYADPGRLAPGLRQNVRVVRRLVRRDNSALAHFFFAPNPRSSLAARLALALRPRPTVQTVCSTPKSFARPRQLLFADRVVVLSQHTRQRFIEAGVLAERLRHIPPGIQIPALAEPAACTAARRDLGLPTDRPLVIFPGDYQFSRAAETFAQAIIRLGPESPASFVFACRIKQAESLAEEQRLRQLLQRHGVGHKIHMLRQVDRMLDLLAACDLCVLPAESLYAKMDLPLVLLEAMALEVPVVVADIPPLNELQHPDAVLAVPPTDAGALASCVAELLANPQRLAHMGREARRLARERYAIDAVARQHEALYSELLGR